MMDFAKARELLETFKAGRYIYGLGVLGKAGPATASLGKRAALVCTRSLAEFAGQIGLGDHLFLGRGEDDGGGRGRPAVLCGAFEALIGAIYLDQGLPQVRDFVMPIFEPALEHILQYNLDKDPKSVLQELSQAQLGYTPRYTTVGTHGPDHDRLFMVAAMINGVTYGKGEGRSKQLSGQAAAADAIKQLEAMLNAPVVRVPDGPEFDILEEDLVARQDAT